MGRSCEFLSSFVFLGLDWFGLDWFGLVWIWFGLVVFFFSSSSSRLRKKVSLSLFGGEMWAAVFGLFWFRFRPALFSLGGGGGGRGGRRVVVSSRRSGRTVHAELGTARRSHRMEITDDPKLPNAITVIFRKQDHTLGGMLRSCVSLPSVLEFPPTYSLTNQNQTT
jgi:hypothetical protein